MQQPGWDDPPLALSARGEVESFRTSFRNLGRPESSDRALLRNLQLTQ
jgi:hypothetical protein